MGVLTEAAQWAANVFKIDTDTVWKGGDDGDANKQGQALANRTTWLKAQVEALALAISNLFSASDYQKATAITANAGGTADAITAAFNPVITALTHGMTLYVRAAFANATTTPTFTPHSGDIAAKTIVKGAGAALGPGDIAGDGYWIALQYDLTLDKWVLLNPANGIAAQAFASNAEAQGFNLNNKAISPATLDAALKGANQSLAATGYQKMPGGLILQWGAYSVAVGSTQAITFPIAFPAACQAVTTGLYEAAATDHVKVAIDAVTESGFTARGDAVSGTAAGRWVAIGY